MSTLQEINERKSVRVFEDIPVSKEVKAQLTHAALQAPTAGNQNLYSILDITDSSIKEKLAELCDHQPFIATAPVVYVFVIDHQRWTRIYQSAGCDPRPAGLADIWLAQADCCIAAQNMVVAAHSLGLGSCYIGDIIENGETIKELLNLPDQVMPGCMLVLGYPTQQQKQRTKPERFDEKYVVFENQYHDLSLEEAKEAYTERLIRNHGSTLNIDEQITRFFNRKFMSPFCTEMNRSIQFYIEKFLK